MLPQSAGVGELHAPAALPAGKNPGTHCTGGWAGPRGDLDACGENTIYWPTGVRNPNRPARSYYINVYMKFLKKNFRDLLANADNVANTLESCAR
jgi:hypothetical protein